MSATEDEKNPEFFRKDFPSMADYFSPAIKSLQDFLGVGSKEVLYQLGAIFGQKMGERYKSIEPKQMLEELSIMWEKMEIGRLNVEKTDPLTILVSDCRVCGQLPGTGGMYNCAFHEGFFQSLLTARFGGRVALVQQTNFEGIAGTWCRRFVADVKV